MSYQMLRVLIWGKTYPELSNRYTETVCTGGVREDGTPIRLYPVPLRYLDGGKQYQLYDWIDVPAQKSRSDPRPESFRVVSDHITRVGRLQADGAGWRMRRDVIFRNPSWHFGSVAELKRAEHAAHRSMGLVAPKQIVDVQLVRKSAGAHIEYDEKMSRIQAQADMFRPEYKELRFLDFDIQLRWRCIEPCPECSRRPHHMKVLDWGLLELGRRVGWEKARAKLEEIANLQTHDFRLFLGNFRLHPKNFGIIGLWYPKRPSQLDLL